MPFNITISQSGETITLVKPFKSHQLENIATVMIVAPGLLDIAPESPHIELTMNGTSHHVNHWKGIDIFAENCPASLYITKGGDQPVELCQISYERQWSYTVRRISAIARGLVHR